MALYVALASAFSLPSFSGGLVATIVRSLFTGDGYYHLYYIVVTVQFYIFFPWIIAWARRLDVRRAIAVAAALGLAYLGLMAGFAAHPYGLDLSGGGVARVIQFLYAYRDRLLFSYLPYFVFGTLIGLNLEAFGRFIRSHRRHLAIAAAGAGGYLILEWYVRVVRGAEDFGTFVTVFRPAMFLYSLAVFPLIYLAATGMARSRSRVAAWLRAMSPCTFGIYLIHPMILFFLETYVFRYFASFHPLLIVPLWLAATILCYEVIQALAGSRLGTVLFGLKKGPTPAKDRRGEAARGRAPEIAPGTAQNVARPSKPAASPLPQARL